MSSFQWDDASAARLAELVDAGMSASQIAKEIGGVSKSAVISKISRSNLKLAGPDVVWSKERDEKLLSLLRGGSSYGYIASELGVSRNAVAGRLVKLRGSRSTARKRAPQDVWTAERIAELKEFAAAGHTAAAIAKMFDVPVSRSAVCSAAFRHGISLAQKALAKRQVHRSKLQNGDNGEASHHPGISIDYAARFTAISVGPGVEAHDLSSCVCHWPLGEFAEISRRWCGEAVKRGSVYCERHHAVAYRPSNSRSAA